MANRNRKPGRGKHDRRRARPGRPDWVSLKVRAKMQGNPLVRCDFCVRRQSADMLMSFRGKNMCDACWTHHRRHNTKEWGEIISNLRKDED